MGLKIVLDLKNIFVIVFVCGSLVSFIINQLLEFIDCHARKTDDCSRNGNADTSVKVSIPAWLKEIPGADEVFTAEKLSKIRSYEDARYFAWIPSSVCTLIVSIALMLFGFYPFLFEKICLLSGFPSSLGNTFLCFFLFVIISSIPTEIFSIPFALYREFVVEKKFGFSNMTFKLWIKDYIKETLLSLILGALLCFIASVVLVIFKTSWWFLLCAVLIVFTVVMQIVYPKFIAPLFNKFSPLEEGELKDKINDLLEKTGFVSDGVFVMDASKRSGHSNAYFTGFGKAKRIVLYDTLVKSLTPDELVAVLGHELGHYKLHHILRRMIFMIPLEFAVSFLLYKFAGLVSLYTAFGFKTITAENVLFVQFIGLFLAAEVYSSVTEIFSPVVNYFSRRDEYQADAYSAKVTGQPQNLVSALVKLNSENLSELFPPKIYVIWNYSHPTLKERAEALNKLKK